MLRVISNVRPSYVLAENVRGLLSIENGMVFENCLLDLENLEYEVQAFIIPACAVNAPHRRDRVWIVAHTESNRFFREKISIQPWKSQQKNFDTSWADRPASDSEGIKKRAGLCQGEQTGERWRRLRDWDGEDWYEVATALCRVDDGVSRRVDRLKSLGNAVVPQIVEQIGKAIMECKAGRRAGIL